MQWALRLNEPVAEPGWGDAALQTLTFSRSGGDAFPLNSKQKVRATACCTSKESIVLDLSTWLGESHRVGSGPHACVLTWKVSTALQLPGPRAGHRHQGFPPAGGCGTRRMCPSQSRAFLQEPEISSGAPRGCKTILFFPGPEIMKTALCSCWQTSGNNARIQHGAFYLPSY